MSLSLWFTDEDEPESEDDEPELLEEDEEELDDEELHRRGGTCVFGCASSCCHDCGFWSDYLNHSASCLKAPQSGGIPPPSCRSSPSPQIPHHSSPRTPESDMTYDEGIWPLVLDTDNFAELLKPALKVVLGCVFAITFHIDFWVSDSC